MSQLGADSIIFANGHKQKYCTPPGYYLAHDGQELKAYNLLVVKWARNFDFLSEKMNGAWLRLA